MSKLKPSDLKGICPMDSIDHRIEHEQHMMYVVGILAKNGDVFRELSYDEYTSAGGKDTKKLLDHFNDYIKSADTIALYSPVYKDQYKKYKA